MKILVIVPAFNEEESIESVILDLRGHGYRHLVIVDDGSLDRTATIARKLKVPVISHHINRGLGAALGTGLAYARSVGPDMVVTFDADGQHKARDIKKLLGPLNSNKADVVIGSRLMRDTETMPVDRQVLNWLSNFLTFLLYGVWTTDSQSGLRAFGRRAWEKITIKTERMEVSSEFFKEIKRHQLWFTEVAIKPIYTKYSRTSGQSNLNAVNVAAKMLLRLFR